MEVGKAYYFMSHAYHHFIGVVVEIGGPSRARITNVIRVQSCRRGWTEFFAEGLKDDTIYTHFPDGWVTGAFGIFEWNHDIPKPEGRRGTS